MRTHDPCPGLRSVHAGTNLRSHLGHRFPHGFVSLELWGVPRVPPGVASLPPLGVKERDADDSPLIFHLSIVAHHRRSGQVFTQDQEEMILIGAFGLFWFGKSQV